MTIYNFIDQMKNSEQNSHILVNDDFKLLLPLKIKGRPRRRRYLNKIVRKNFKYISPLETLYEHKIITQEQFNAGQSYAYLIKYIHKNIPLPQLAMNKYQEKVTGAVRNLKDYNENHVKSCFNLWRQIILNLKKRGEIPKMMLSGFLDCAQQEIESMSEDETRNLQQALNYLVCFYKNKKSIDDCKP